MAIDRHFRAAVCLSVAAAIAASLLTAAFAGPVAVAQSVGDVEARDQLIANQENLLNTYRCLFGVDVDVVPGGCPEPDAVSPGVAPENPTQQDLDVRDGLIGNQEALLNIYRCRFDVDTEIVPGGCVDGKPGAVVELPPAGWYPDPTGRFSWRWWDGTQWSSWVSDPKSDTGRSQDIPPGSLDPTSNPPDPTTVYVPDGEAEPEPAVEAAWLADPTCRNEYRWWDGQRWTEFVWSEQLPSEDPLGDGENPGSPDPDNPPGCDPALPYVGVCIPDPGTRWLIVKSGQGGTRGEYVPYPYDTDDDGVNDSCGRIFVATSGMCSDVFYEFAGGAVLPTGIPFDSNGDGVYDECLQTFPIKEPPPTVPLTRPLPPEPVVREYPACSNPAPADEPGLGTGSDGQPCAVRLLTWGDLAATGMFDVTSTGPNGNCCFLQRAEGLKAHLAGYPTSDESLPEDFDYKLLANITSHMPDVPDAEALAYITGCVRAEPPGGYARARGWARMPDEATTFQMCNVLWQMTAGPINHAGMRPEALCVYETFGRFYLLGDTTLGLPAGDRVYRGWGEACGSWIDPEPDRTFLEKCHWLYGHYIGHELAAGRIRAYDQCRAYTGEAVAAWLAERGNCGDRYHLVDLATRFMHREARELGLLPENGGTVDGLTRHPNDATSAYYRC